MADYTFFSYQLPDFSLENPRWAGSLYKIWRAHFLCQNFLHQITPKKFLRQIFLQRKNAFLLQKTVLT